MPVENTSYRVKTEYATYWCKCDVYACDWCPLVVTDDSDRHTRGRTADRNQTITTSRQDHTTYSKKQ